MAMTPSAQFHAHLDRCKRCAEQPFNLCPVGAQLLGAAGAPPREADPLEELEKTLGGPRLT